MQIVEPIYDAISHGSGLRVDKLLRQ